MIKRLLLVFLLVLCVVSLSYGLETTFFASDYILTEDTIVYEGDELEYKDGIILFYNLSQINVEVNHFTQFNGSVPFVKKNNNQQNKSIEFYFYNASSKRFVKIENIWTKENNTHTIWAYFSANFSDFVNTSSITAIFTDGDLDEEDNFSVEFSPLTITFDSLAPIIGVLSPLNATRFLHNEIITASALIESSSDLDFVFSILQFPDGSNSSFVMNNASHNYSTIFSSLTQKGNYSFTIFANDSVGQISSLSGFFTRTPSNNTVLDIVNSQGNLFYFTQAITKNNSGILDVELNFTNETILSLEIIGYNSSSPFGLLAISSNTSDEDKASRTFAINPLSIDAFAINITVPAIGNSLYKCLNFTFSNNTCNDGYEFVMDITPNENYTFTINATDPGFIDQSPSKGTPDFGAADPFGDGFSSVVNTFSATQADDEIYFAVRRNNNITQQLNLESFINLTFNITPALSFGPITKLSFLSNSCFNNDVDGPFTCGGAGIGGTPNNPQKAQILNTSSGQWQDFGVYNVSSANSNEVNDTFNLTTSLTNFIDNNNLVSVRYESNITISTNGTDAAFGIDLVQLSVFHPPIISGGRGGSGGGRSGNSASIAHGKFNLCTPGERSCFGDQVSTCIKTSRGTLWDYESCGRGRTCRNNKCVKSICGEDWICSAYGKCIGGRRTRTCEDFNQCGTARFKPPVTTSCYSTSSTQLFSQQKEIQKVLPLEEQPGLFSRAADSVLSVKLLIFLLLLALVTGGSYAITRGPLPALVKQEEDALETLFEKGDEQTIYVPFSYVNDAQQVISELMRDRPRKDVLRKIRGKYPPVVVSLGLKVLQEKRKLAHKKKHFVLEEYHDYISYETLHTLIRMIADAIHHGVTLELPIKGRTTKPKNEKIVLAYEHGTLLLHALTDDEDHYAFTKINITNAESVKRINDLIRTGRVVLIMDISGLKDESLIIKYLKQIKRCALINDARLLGLDHHHILVIGSGYTLDYGENR